MKDGYGREITYLRLSVTELCDLRCRYCMPQEGICKQPRAAMLTEDETICAVEAAASLGVSKLRITGGEPLVKKNILSICARASAVSGIREVCLTTNGSRLPAMAKSLRAAGVSRLNLSLDTLNPKKYAYMTRCGRLDEALAGLHAALDAGFEKVKVNAVLIGGFNDDEIPALAELTRRFPVDVRFIELMPMCDSGDFRAASFVGADTVLKALPEAEPVAPDGGVARLYRLPDAQGRIGLISPISANFCGQCNRLRLTADGKIKPCLHCAAEYGIKGLGREEMAEQFRAAIRAKPQWHDELSYQTRSHAQRNMNEIGG